MTVVKVLPKREAVLEMNFSGQKIGGKHGVECGPGGVGHHVYRARMPGLSGGRNGMYCGGAVSEDE